MAEPEGAESFGEVLVLSEEHWFDEIRVGAPLKGALDVGGPRGSGENDDDNLIERGIFTQAFQRFQTIHTRHFDVEQDDGRQRKAACLSVVKDVEQIRTRGSAKKIKLITGFGEGALAEKAVILVVLGE